MQWYHGVRLLGDLLPLIDRLVESYIGRYERPDFRGRLVMEISELSESSAVEQIQAYGRWLKTDFETLVKGKYLKALPKPPPGKRFALDRNRMQVVVLD
ncbi:MAG: hypothetical protein EB034_06075 [Verrucomicrobia bacterium]|nr:hypothetical protein [Verrucomicrobiota bacterium]